MLGERMRECSLTGTRPLSTSRSVPRRSEEHTSELQSRQYLVCRLLLEKKKKNFEIKSREYQDGTHRGEITSGADRIYANTLLDHHRDSDCRARSPHIGSAYTTTC